MVISGLVLASGGGASDRGLRLTCFGPSWIDGARLEVLCRAVAEGMADTLNREVAVVAEKADVALEVVRLGDSLVMARLHWPGVPPGPDVSLGAADAALTDQSFKSMAAGLLQVAPPP